ncbi:DNA-binding protein [Thermococcus sp. M36]|uniref:FeoC-like transcriptional regulator n=1 Tax=Thermococcus sp. M36 TaxID=1638261 RepID=UPI00143C7168|nr:FeoC-like transcriptional regulator [Thermococcus sp. M36]NJE06049.1 DNA-binding protein [Thermococcus sp. M36]
MLERVLDLLREGKSIEDIARELSMPREEVEGAIKVLESLGYVEKVEGGSPLCGSCPLKSVCPGSCFRFKGKVYLIHDFGMDARK